MKLLGVEAQHFRSFVEPQTLNFGALSPGLYYVTGANEAEPELGANAVGKSSLFDAIYWSVTGKTSRGLRAGAIKNWLGKGRTAVITDWQTAAGTVSVMRMWQPNALEVIVDGDNPRPVDQNELERLLGLDPETLLFCMYFAQFTPKFADLSASDQSALFSSVLSLGAWEQATERSSEAVRLLSARLEGRKVEEARLTGQAEELLASGTDELEHGWEVQNRKRIEAAQSAVDSAQRLVELCLIDASKAKVGSIKFRSLRERELGLAQVVDKFAGVSRGLSEAIEELQRKDYKKCPTCGAPVSNEHIKKELQKKRGELQTADKVWEASIAKHDAALREMSAYRDDEIKHAELEQKLAGHKANLANARKLLLERKADVNPFTIQREREEERGEQLLVQMETVQADIKAISGQIGAAQYWVKGFKEIRLSLIQESLAQLTLECNEVLFQMGLHGWSVAFDVERETKSGGINKNFTIMVQAPEMKDPVPWEVWSGGESQRLRLAVSMGFANLVSSRLGVQPNVELWDEPSSWMTDAGIQDLLSVLAERAQRQKKIILLADHRALEFGGFAGAINITKDAVGSHVVLV